MHLGWGEPGRPAQVISKGGRASQALTAETTHLILVPPVGADDGPIAAAASCASDPSAALSAVREHAGGAAGLTALRVLVEKRRLAVHDARCGAKTLTLWQAAELSPARSRQRWRLRRSALQPGRPKAELCCLSRGGAAAGFRQLAG